MKKIYFKRLMSLVLCIITVLGSFPVSASAQTTDENGAVVYEIGDRVWMRGEEAEPAAESAPQGTFWIPEYDDNDQPVTRQGLCTKQEHRHVYACAPDCALGHTHSETCYTLTYPNCIQHSHDENCTAVTVYACNKAEHDHAVSGCAAAEVCTVHDHSQCVMTKAYTCGMEAHAHDESCIPTPTYPECIDGHTEHTDACPVVTVYSCGKAAHDHEALGCPAEEVCTVHDHSQCVITSSYTCGMEAHVHDESCVPTRAYPNCTEHSHDENCISENQLSCGMEEHICISEGCAPDCAIEEHSHTAECDMDALYYSWELVEDTSSTFAESSDKGLPVHFFIALPGQAANPSGNYENYAMELWGNEDKDEGKAYALPGVGDTEPINSQQGIRNANNENDITKYVDDNTKAIMAELKNFTSLTIGGTTYSGTDYEIKWVTICRRCPNEATWIWDWRQCGCDEDVGERGPHIHIDAVLSKRILPADMKLTKTIPQAEDQQQVFTFNLQRLLQDANYKPINPAEQGFDPNFGSKTLVAEIPAGETSAGIYSTDGTKVGFGYYKLTENTSTGWNITDIIIHRDGYDETITSGDLYIEIATSGDMKFSRQYNTGYTKANGITIQNARRPLNVSYEWSGIPDGLSFLPEPALNLQYGSDYTIDTLNKPGRRVQGTGEDSGYYYEFLGWQYYSTEVGERETITYSPDGEPQPSAINITSDTVIHGLWERHELPRAEGYITINKEFVNRPADAAFANYYISVIHNGVTTEIVPANVGSWYNNGTSWTYDHPISENGEYIVVEGGYNVKGYTAAATSAVEPVGGISTDKGNYIGSEIITDGHKYTEVGSKVDIVLPYDTYAVNGGISALDNDIGIHTATVNFTNTYTKNTASTAHDYPNLIVRKTDSGLNIPLTGAHFEFKKGDALIEGTVESNDVRYEALQPGDYTLRETVAPAGYKLLDFAYIVKVTADGEPVEQRKTVCTESEGHVHDTSCYKFVPVQKYKLTVTDENGKDVNEDSVPGEYVLLEYNTRLSVPNEQITGKLTVTKKFVGADGQELPSDDYENTTTQVHLHGPITRDADGNITNIGPMVKLVEFKKGTDGNFISTIEVENLAQGEYVLREPSASVHGYTWTGVEYTHNGNTITKVPGLNENSVKAEGFAPFTISADSSEVSIEVTNSYAKWTAADFTVSKVKAGTNQGLQGAIFGLYEADCTTLHSMATTGIAGTAEFSGFEVEKNESKIFYLKEIKAPSNYYISTEVYKVTISHGDKGYNVAITDNSGNPVSGWSAADNTLTLGNTEILGQITVNKTPQGESLPEGSYVVVVLSGVTNNYTATATIAAGDKWTHKFTGLPMGSYTVTETYSSTPGYSYTTQYKVNNADTATDGAAATVTIADDSDGTLTSPSLPESAKAQVEFINTYTREEQLRVNPGRFTVLKRDEKGNPLSGAIFTLHWDAQCEKPLVAADMPKDFTVSATSDSYGQAEFYNLKLEDHEYGEYKNRRERNQVFYLKETTAPDGYQLSNTVWQISLKENHVEIDKLTNNSFFETIINWFAGKHESDNGGIGYAWEENNILAVVNQPILGSVKVSKSFVDANGTALDQSKYQNARVEFHLHGPITRNEQGVITDLGTERRIELKTDESSPFPTTVTKGNLALGEYAIHEAFASVHGYSWTGKEYKVNGVVGTEQPVEGIDKSVFFNVTDATPVKIAVKNTYAEWDKADFYVRKLKTGTQTELKGAVFSLYTDDACTTKVTGITATQTTDGAGLAHFDGLEVDENKSVTYFLREDTAPTGYRRDETVYPVTVSHNNSGYMVSIGTTGSSASWVTGTDTLWVYNDEILGEVQLTKRFVDADAPNAADLGEYTPEAINLIFAGPGQPKTVTLNEENKWTATIHNLPMGRYAVYEQPANVDGYNLVSTAYTVSTVNQSDAGQGTPTVAEYATVNLTPEAHEQAVTVTNTYERIKELTVNPASFRVLKQDEDGKPLSGATFTLHSDASCNSPLTANEVPDGFTVSARSGEDGYAHFNYLKLADLGYSDYDEEYQQNKERTQTYYLKETDAPDGYDASQTIWKISLKENLVSIGQYNAGKGFFETLVNWITDIVGNGTAGGEVNWSNEQTITVTNNRIKGKLTLTKSFLDEEGNTLDETAYENARIALHVHGPITRDDDRNITDIGPQVKEVIFAKDPNQNNNFISTATVENLVTGEYVIREPFPSVHGYTWKGVEYTEGSTVLTQESGLTDAGVSAEGFAAFKITADKRDVTIEVENSYKKWDAVDFYVVKLKTGADGSENADNPKLPGATFKLYHDPACTQPVDENDAFTTEATTGVAGYAHFTGYTVPDGETKQVYYLKESNPPTNYSPDNTVYKLVIDHNNNNEYDVHIKNLDDDKLHRNWDAARDALMVYNTEIMGQITVKKDFDGADLGNKKPAGIEVTLSGNNITETVTLNKGNSWTHQFTGLPMGEYTIVEQPIKLEDYLLSTSYVVPAVNDSASGTEASDKATVVLAPNATSRDVIITNTYSKKTLNVSASTIEVVKLGENGQPLKDAVFTLYEDKNCTKVLANVPFEVSATSDENGLAVFSDLKLDDLDFDSYSTGSVRNKTFYMQESQAPAGYERSNTVWTITLDESYPKIDELSPDKSISETVVNWLAGKHSSDLGGADYKWISSNRLQVINKPFGSVTVSKVFKGIADEDKPAKIKFSLTGNGIDQEIVLPDENGKWEKRISNLPMGEYTVVEQPAIVDGYVLNTGYTVDSVAQNGATSATVELTTNKTDSTVTVTNSYEKKELTVVPTDFTVKKLETGSDKPLKDAVFLLYDENKNTIATATSNENGIALFKDLKMDDRDYEDYKDTTRSVTYYLTETVAPAGFEKDGTVWKVQLSENVTLFDEEDEKGKFGIVSWIAGIFQTGSDTAIEGDVLTVYNSRKTYPVSVKKTVTYQGLTDPANDYMVKYSLSKAEYEFALYIDGGVQPVEAVKLKAGEEKSFTKTVPYGSSYEVRELTAEKPIFSSVLSANAKGKVETELSGPIAVTAENTYRFTDGGNPIVLEMVKVSGDIYRRPLAGARFSLRDSGNELLGAYESDINGRFYISGVFNAPGTYWLIENRAPAGYRAGGPIAIDVKYDISVIYNADNQPVIVRTPVATVTGSHVFHIANNAYGVKNDVIFTPKTGDDNDMMLWSVLSLFGLLGTGSAFTLSRRKRYKSRH